MYDFLCGMIGLVCLPLLVLTIVFIAKSCKPAIKTLSVVSCVMASIFLIVCTGMAVSVRYDEINNDTETTMVETEAEESGWRADFSPELVAEIEAAFTEIGENPDKIVSIEYVDTHTSGYVFEQKCYKVELSRFGFKHSRHYRIVTQNYYDGEPEKEEYPNEFLCTIKYWVGDDGHGTNVNQWSWTGNGVKQ